jgi:hypothetical protein
MPVNAFSNYPSGFSHGVTLHGLPVLNVHFGNVWWVHSVSGTNTGGANGSRNQPFATLDYAIGKSGDNGGANNGDIIMVGPNHAETITGAGGITADVAGQSIIGMGTYNQRPRFLMDGGTAVTAAVSAADVTFSNLVFAAGHSDIVTCFNVSAVGCTLDRVEFADNTTDEDWLVCVKALGADNTADGLKVVNSRWVSPDAGATEMVEITGNLADLVLAHNFVSHLGVASPIVQSLTTKNITNALIVWNYIMHRGADGTDLLIDNGGSSNSGIVAHNRVGHADATSTHIMGAATGLRFFDNLSTSVATASGFVLPAIDVDS